MSRRASSQQPSQRADEMTKLNIDDWLMSKKQKDKEEEESNFVSLQKSQSTQALIDNKQKKFIELHFELRYCFETRNSIRAIVSAISSPSGPISNDEASAATEHCET